VISGFSREVEENCALLGYNAASSGNFLTTFRGNLCSAALMNSFLKFSHNRILLFTDQPRGLVVRVSAY